jgi:hypothetical protein
VRTERALEHLERRAELLGIDLKSLEAGTAVDLVLGWFLDERADDALPLDQEGDGILFQWGTYDFGDGPTFRYVLTRQFMLKDGEDVRLLQLSLTLHFRTGPQTAALGRVHEWCFHTDGIPGLRQAIQASAATQYVSTRNPEKVTLDYSGV